MVSKKRENIERELSYVLNAISKLEYVNETLKCNLKSQNRSEITDSFYLGLIEGNEFHGNDGRAMVKFVDKYNISNYFPGYIKNKTMWETLRNKYIPFSEFKLIVYGDYDYIKEIKNRKTIFDY